MNNFIKLNTLILTFFMIFLDQSVAAERIFPLPKPSVDKEIKRSIAQKKVIYPKEKPLKEKKEEEIDNNNENTTSSVSNIDRNDSSDEIVFVYPKKKPTLVKKEIHKVILKSTILSKRDFKIAKKTFEAIDKRKWETALKLSKKSKDKTLRKLVNYLYLKKTSNNATFYEYANFIKNNDEFPRLNRLRYLAEHKINLKTNTPSVILKWFGEKEPLSDFGKIKLGEIYFLEGKIEDSSRIIKDAWIRAKLSKGNLKYLRKKYKNIITVEDNVKRADWHAWEGKHWDLQRMLRYLPKDYTALYRARQLLMSKSYGVDKAISDVPEKFKNDIGLKYDRLKWRRKRGRLKSFS